MFDRAEIRIRSGDGGRGAVGFRREMYVRFGGPDGGDGGKGGDVIIKADNSTDTLRFFAHSKLYRAENGLPGAGKKKSGKNGKDLILSVPPGTIIIAKEADGAELLLADLGSVGEK